MRVWGKYTCGAEGLDCDHFLRFRGQCLLGGLVLSIGDWGVSAGDKVLALSI